MSLNVFQQVFTLSLISNYISSIKGTQAALQQRLQTEVNNTLPKIGAGWRLAWGPVVWKEKPDDADTGPDNSWYIAFNPSLQFEDGSVRSAYVIAIAGTPVESQYAWFEENFAVNSVSSFNAWVDGGIQNPPTRVPLHQIQPGEPYIATGTATGVHLLLTTAAPEGAEAAGMTLLDFIANLDYSDSSRVITTGHSLGGALSPSLALALVSAGVIPTDNTLTYPSAGASPGNGGFADLFSQTFPAIKLDPDSLYEGWNLNLVNTLDIVPQAWCPSKEISEKQNMGNIPPIYGLPEILLVSGATLVFNVHALSSGVFYNPLPSQYFTGPPPPIVPTDLIQFLEILGPQHLDAYLDVVGVGLPTSNLPLGGGLTEKSKEEKRRNDPVIAEFEWEYEHPKEARKIIHEVEDSPEGREVSLKMKH